MARSSGVGQVTCDDDRGDKEDDGNGRNLASITPEDKFGPDGYDPPGTEPGLEQRFITPGQVMEYRVDFWNREDAEVPTQDAVIYDYLDPALFDFSTFEFTRVGFLAWDMPLPGGQSIDVRIDARPEMNISVDVTASFDPETGRIEWWFHGVDPLTGDYPEDPMVGFLPPFNPLTQFELGWVEFRVQAWDDLATGTRIENQAFVQFDFLGPWGPAPKDGPWVNTIDAGPPTSNVLPLPATAITRLFPVAWQGIDDAGGSGVAHYDVYVSAEGGPYELWQESTTDTSGHYLGQPGRTYRFYAVATDNVGHRQPTPAAAQATTTVSLLSPWHNTSLRGDVNRDGLVTLGDALLVVQGLRDNGIGYEHLGVPGATDPLLDVNGDWIASLSDVLEVINILRAQRDADPEPEGEAFGVAPAVPESPFAIWSITGRRAWASSLLPERDEENELSATASVDGWRGDDATAGVLALATSAHQPAFQAGDESAAGRDVDWRWEDLPLDEIVADLTLSATAGDRPVPNSDHGQEWRG